MQNKKVRLIKNNCWQVGEIIDFGNGGVIVQLADGATLGLMNIEIALMNDGLLNM